jgi:tetratricopeptide (TPR) repeat protein
MTGRYDEALAAYQQLFDRARKDEFPLLGAHLFLAEVYAELGRVEEARKHGEAVRKSDPRFSLKRVGRLATYRYEDPANLERRLGALRKAGLR